MTDRDAAYWRDIDTAPRDGTEILVRRPGHHAVVHWLAREQMSWLEHDEETRWVDGWYISDGKNDPIWYRGWIYLTDWMALPAAPQAPTAPKDTSPAIGGPETTNGAESEREAAALDEWRDAEADRLATSNERDCEEFLWAKYQEYRRLVRQDTRPENHDG